MDCEIEPHEDMAGKQFVIRISSLTREYFFAASSVNERTEVIKILKNHKRHAIKQAMGHEQISQDELLAAKVCLFVT